MPQLDFYNMNAGRHYPLVDDFDEVVFYNNDDVGELVTIPKSVLLDAGFILGILAGYDSDEEVFFLEILRDTALTFIFKTDSGAVEFRFTRNPTDPFACTDYVTTYGSDYRLGTAYLVTGPLSDLYDALASGTRWRAYDWYRVEPGTVQSLANSEVTSISLGFMEQTPYDLPQACQSSSSSSANPNVIVTQRDMTGHVMFTAGYNCDISVKENRNEISIAAGSGYGEGDPCGEMNPEEPSSLVPQLDGVACVDVISSISGVKPDSTGGITISSGSAGIEVIPYAEEHRIVINFNIRSLDGVFCLEDSG